MRQLSDLTGLRFGRLQVLGRGENSNQGKPRWICACDCGGEALCALHSLKTGATQSCGCLQRERTGAAARISSRTHGMAQSPEHRCWSTMLSRCYNPKATGYSRYGGRGIKVHRRWRHSFENFLADMGERPSLAHTVDRIDKDGNYAPSNCRWATKLEQANNRRDNRIVTIGGEEMTLPDACRKFGDVVHYGQAWRRIKLGWPHDVAVSEPPNGLTGNRFKRRYQKSV